MQPISPKPIVNNESIYDYIIQRNITSNNCNVTQINDFMKFIKYDFHKNVYPILCNSKSSILSTEDYNRIISKNNELCDKLLKNAYSSKYYAYRTRIYSELILWIHSLPSHIRPTFNLNVIQPDQIIMFLTSYYIPKHGSKTGSNDILEEYIISNSTLKTVIGAISGILSSLYGRNYSWSINNPEGNPCKAEIINLFKKAYRTILEKHEKVTVVAAPITVRILKEIIDKMDDHISENKNAILNPKKASPNQGPFMYLSYLRDIAYYLYLFASSQRGGEGCLVKTTNMEFHRDQISEELVGVDILIPAHDQKNKKANKIFFKYKEGIKGLEGHKYCFMVRYLHFIEECKKYPDCFTCDVNKINILNPGCMFPHQKKGKRFIFDNELSMNFQACLVKFKKNIDTIGLSDKYGYLTLHSFRRGSIMNYKKHKEDKKLTKKRANMTDKMYDHYSNKQLKTKKSSIQSDSDSDSDSDSNS